MRPPPGYPFVGDLKSRPPPPGEEPAASSAGVVAFVLAFAGAMTGAGFMLVALVAAEARHSAAMVADGPQMSLTPSVQAEAEASDADGPPSRVVDSPVPLAPPIERNIPVFPARFLEGCSAHDLEAIERGLGDAIAVGAPLYNDGDVAGCVVAYEHAARELEAALPASCSGPVRALSEGRATAGKLALPGARAWAMRDAFDGLIEIMDRSRRSGVQNL